MNKTLFLRARLLKRNIVVDFLLVSDLKEVAESVAKVDNVLSEKIPCSRFPRGPELNRSYKPTLSSFNMVFGSVTLMRDKNAMLKEERVGL
jgi:hypothetical protein